MRLHALVLLAIAAPLAGQVLATWCDAYDPDRLRQIGARLVDDAAMALR